MSTITLPAYALLPRDFPDRVQRPAYGADRDLLPDADERQLARRAGEDGDALIGAPFEPGVGHGLIDQLTDRGGLRLHALGQHDEQMVDLRQLRFTNDFDFHAGRIVSERAARVLSAED